MSITETPQRANLLTRMRGILFSPTAEWAIIRSEPSTIPQLFLGYACLLVLLPIIAGFLQLLFHYHVSLLAVAEISIVSYALTIGAIFVEGMFFNASASMFGGEKNLIQAMKAAVYSQTAGCVAGIVTGVPFLGFVMFLAGIYGLYILWLGLPRLMKVRADKALGYVVLNLVLTYLLNLVVLGLIFVSTRAIITAFAQAQT